MPYEPGMQIVFDLISQMAVVSFRGTIDMIGPFATQRLAIEAGEGYCRYLVEIVSVGTAHWWDWLLAILYLVAFMGIVMQFIGFRILADVNSPYPFTPEEMNRNEPKGQLHRGGITPRT